MLRRGAKPYVVTDVSGAAIAALAGHRDRLLGNLELLQMEAADAVELTRCGIDLVVLNSVVQYFPSVAYLSDIVDRAFELLPDGGRVFLGDIRIFRRPNVPADGGTLLDAGAFRYNVVVERGYGRERPCSSRAATWDCMPGEWGLKRCLVSLETRQINVGDSVEHCTTHQSATTEDSGNSLSDASTRTA
ncbi:hypothetical protein [Mycobacterium sp. 050134]|uniref:hypothetical protein n=1 Tax=Mycobacterium sp. 050134 TaxID=3096111 RepID=UPI002ED994FD